MFERNHPFDFDTVSTTADTDVGRTVSDNGAIWVYVKNTSAATIAIGSSCMAEVSDAAAHPYNVEGTPTSSPCDQVVGWVQRTALTAGAYGWVKRTGPVEVTVVAAGAMSKGARLKVSTATAGYSVAEATATNPAIAYLLDAIAGASTVTVTAQSLLPANS